jgi:hypothetical protein
VIGYVKDAAGATLPGVTVKLSHPANGVIGPAATSVSDDQGLYEFDDIPHGPRVVQLEPGLSYQRGTGYTTGGARNNVEFSVENLGQLPTSITSVEITWLSDPVSDFRQLRINGALVFNGTASSGSTIAFGSHAVAGTGVIQEPFHLDVSGLMMQTPDAIIGTAGTGGVLDFEMTDFEQAGTNTNIDMTGVTFALEFSDGSRTVFAPVRQ